MMEASTTAAIVALVFAVLAFLIAFAQALQQYAASGQLIRLCDSVVYGGKNGWPGQGRRVWSMRQFRFRILYSVPRLIVEPLLIGEIFEAMENHSELRRPDLVALKEIPQLTARPAVGEATWVSLARSLSAVHAGRRFVNTVQTEADADRCPGDVPNVTMAVSMRDVAIFGLTLGMKCLHASFTDKRLAMQGEAGSLFTTQHPMLGTLVRFEPYMTELTSDKLAPWSKSMLEDFHRNWIWRVFGFVTQRSSRVYPSKLWSQWIDGTQIYSGPKRRKIKMSGITPWEYFSLMDNHPARYATPWNSTIRATSCTCLVRGVMVLLQDELKTHTHNLVSWPLTSREDIRKIWCSLSCHDISIPTGKSCIDIPSSEPEHAQIIAERYRALHGLSNQYLAPPILREPRTLTPWVHIPGWQVIDEAY